MVPFYGQGLNCGLEDVRILTALMDQEGVTPYTLELVAGDSKTMVDRRVARALERYTVGRHRDLVAIADLAMDN